MDKKNIRKKISKYSNGGNAYLLLEYLLDLNQSEIQISQKTLSKELNKTRPSIQKCLHLLMDLKLIDVGYKNIKILGDEK